ncbi:MAG: coproporphyrinogen-III oxidase family protein [Acidimicrobiales bacterium]
MPTSGVILPNPSAVVRHLYVHVPFCPTICPFCSFHVVERRAAAVDAYLARLDRELAVAAERLRIEPDTVYLGGGTPSYLRPAEMERLCAIVDRRVGWSRVEATLEVHPSTATEERVAAWSSLGFDRFSVGVQSFDDGVLRTLGRPHDAATSRRVVEWCLATGAVTSLDLITAVDGQDLAADLAAAVATGVHHVSAYTLTIEEGTPFERAGVHVAEEAERDAIDLVASTLSAAGFGRYEVSNHARPGAQCAHNRGYWEHDASLGVGPSAASLLDVAGSSGEPAVARFANPHLDEWLACDDDDLGPDADDVVTGDALLDDVLLCGLRLAEGVDLSRAAARCGLTTAAVRDALAPTVERLVTDGVLRVDGDRIAATPAGVPVLDGVTASLMARPATL